MSWLSMLEDRYEGKSPKIITEELQKALLSAEDEARQAAINDSIEILCRFAAGFYPNYFVSCWSMRDVESDLMWRSYTTSAEAVAVQTTFARLEQSLPPYVDIGLVRYIDYQTQGFGRMNMFEWPMHKRLQYAEDREVRVLANAALLDQLGGKELRSNLFEGGTSSQSVRVCAPPVNISTLIEAIYLHPSAGSKFTDKAAKFCHAHRLPEPRLSELAAVGSF